MTVSVIVPRGGDCEHRARAWAWCRARYAERLPGWEIVEGRYDDGEFVKAVAVWRAVRASSGDVLVVADADVWTDAIGPAAAAVAAGLAWAVPHSEVRRLDQAATARVLAGEPPDPSMLLARSKYRGIVGGGAVVLPRALYEEVPMDPRFVGWGGEDNAWGHALAALAGTPTRFQSSLWHLWHPTAEHPGIRGSSANTTLARRYQRARANTMRALVEEAHAALAGET